MSHLVTTSTTAPPTTLYTRAQTHLRVGADPVDSDVLNGFVQAAIADFEQHTGIVVFDKGKTLYLDGWPSNGEIDLRCGPVSAVTSVKYIDSAGAEQTVAASDYFTDLGGSIGRVILKSSFSLPETEEDHPTPVSVSFTAGFGPTLTPVPELLIAGLLLYTAHLYVNRDATAAEDLEGVKRMFFDRYKMNFFGTE